MARPEPVPPCIHKTPARKIALRDELYDIVYERTHQHFEETLTAIRDKNRLTLGYSWDGFTHRGVYYGTPIHPGWTAVTKYQVRNQKLDASLVPAMDQLLAERQEVEQVEGVMVRTILGTVLNASQCVGDYKRLLPSLLHPKLTEVEGECACYFPPLPQSTIYAIKARHGKYIGLIQRRQLIYLLVP